jgi:hypothetical protein
VIGVALVVLFEPFITIPCDNEESNQPTELKFKNVLFTYTPCMEYRYPHLLFLTRMDCQKARHLLVAVFLGSLIGYERRSADRPAGIRTMALVSLGSALFTINSTFAFLAGPMVSDGIYVNLGMQKQQTTNFNTHTSFASSHGMQVEYPQRFRLVLDFLAQG